MHARAEIAWVRAGSRLAAVAVAALFAASALRPAPVYVPAASNATNVRIVSAVELVESPTPVATAPRPQRVERRRITLASAEASFAPEAASEGEGHRMWLHTGVGRTAFKDTDHYLRCLDAALAHVEAAGCPPPPPRLRY